MAEFTVQAHGRGAATIEFEDEKGNQAYVEVRVGS
jgi:hypothetical protein